MEDESSNLSTFDIYSDLLLEQHQTSSIHVSVEQLEKTNAEYEAKLKELTQQLHSLQTQNAATLGENKILKTNISQLFKTAQAELQRKDKQLEDLANRGPRYRQEIDYKSSINERLRDLRKPPRALEQNIVRDASDNQDRELGKSGDAQKPCYHQLGRGTSAAIDSKEKVCMEKTSDSNDNQHVQSIAVKMELAKVKLGTNVDSQSKNYELCSNLYQEKTPHRQSMSSFRIPKKSKSSHSNSLSGKEISEEGKSSESGIFHSRSRDSKRSDHMSTVSHLKYTRNKDAVQSKSSNSPRRGQSSHSPRRGQASHSPRRGQSSRSRSKSRERPSHYSDRSTNRTGYEQCSRRKRRHSSEERTSGHLESGQSYHSHSKAPHKKHKGELITKSTDKRHRDTFPDKRSFKKQKNDDSSGKKELTSVRERKRYSSKTSSQPKKEKARSLAERDNCTRKRHQSDRTNKSLKRAKETLHRLHSTPTKHERDENDEYNKYKHRKHHNSRREESQSKDNSKTSFTNWTSPKVDVIEDLEEGEIPGSNFEDTCDEFTIEKSQEDFESKRRQELRMFSFDLKESTTSRIKESKKTSEKMSTLNLNSICTAVPEIVHKSQNKKMFAPSSIVHNAGTISVTSRTQFREASKNQGSHASFKSDNTELKGTTIQSKELFCLRMPDESCGYPSEHETILVFAPSSEDDDSKSESESKSASSSSPDAVSKHQTVKHRLEEEAEGSSLILQGQHISSKENIGSQDSDILRIDTSDNQSKVKNIVRLDPKLGESANFKTEMNQTEPILKSSRNDPRLKPKLSPIKNTTNINSDLISDKNSFIKTVVGTFGSSSILSNDDGSEMTDDNTCIGTRCIKESSLAGTEMPSNDKQTTKEKSKEGSMGSSISKVEYLRQELLSSEDENQCTAIALKRQDAECSTTHSADASSTTFMDKSTPCHSKAIEENISDHKMDNEKSPKDQVETEFADSSACRLCLPEADNVADMSINPPSFDVLSCSASPAHDSLLGDSDSNCHSDEDDKDNVQGDSEYSDQDDQSNQDACTESEQRQDNGTPSKSTNLSDGEIVSNSDAEDVPKLKVKSQGGDRRLKPKHSESSRNRSRDKQPSSQKDRSRPTKHEEDRDRTQFFKKKMRILEDRRRAQDDEGRKFSIYPEKRNRSYDPHEVPRNRLESKDKHQEKKLRSIVHKEIHDGNQRWRASRRVEDDKRFSSRHMGEPHNGKRHDKHGSPERKHEKGKVTEKGRAEKERSSRRGYKR